MSEEIDAQKLELLRLALPKGLSAGDTGLVEPRGMPDVMNGFPQFRSAITQTKQYSNTPSISIDPPLVQNAKKDTQAHPFQVRLETNEEGDPKYIIELNSNLYKGLANYEKQNITGLDFQSTPSTGFLSLFGVIEDGVCTEASIDGPIEVPSDRIDIVDFQQISFNYLIAYLFQDGDSWKVRQLCFQDLTLMNSCVNGLSCVYPFAV